MNKEYIEMLKDAMSDPEHLTPEKIQGFLSLTVNHLLSLRDKINSQDVEEKEVGLTAAEELKEVMEEQIELVRKLVNISPEELEGIFAEGSKEAEFLTKAKEELNTPISTEKKKSKKIKIKNFNLVG